MVGHLTFLKIITYLNSACAHSYCMTWPLKLHLCNIIRYCPFVNYLNFANPDKMSILLNNISSFQGTAIFEPAEGGRWHSHGGALQLQWTVYRYGQLFWRAGAGYLRRLWIRKQNVFGSVVPGVYTLTLTSYRKCTDCVVITEHSEVKALRAASSLVTSHAAVEARV